MFGLERKENTGLVKQEVIHMNLGKNIAELRKKSNLTQEELANAWCFTSGCFKVGE